MKKKTDKPYDKASKDLLDIFQIDIVSFFTNTSPDKITFEGTELSIPDRRVDSSFKIDNKYILNLEFQTKYEKGIEFRMLLYNTLLRAKHKLPVRTILIYLTNYREKSIKEHYSELCFGTSTYFNFEVVKVWELDKDKIFSENNYALYPFLAVSKKDPKLVDDVYNRILDSSLSKEKRDRLVSSLSALLNLFYEQEVIKNMLSQLPKFDIIEEWKKDARKEGLSEGRAEGRAEGRVEGRAEGIAKGKAEGETEKAKAYAIKLISKKFGKLPTTLEKKIKNCNDISKLDKIPEIIFDVSDIKEILKLFK
jgi:predicted transposase YdaD